MSVVVFVVEPRRRVHMRRHTVLLADDHAVVTDGIFRILSERFDVVGTVADGDLLVEAAGRLRPDVVVMDISMPTLSGFEALGQLRKAHSDSKVVFLTMHADARLAAEGFRLGAKGFVLKHTCGDELVRAIEAVLQGQTYLPTSLIDDVLMLASAPPGREGVELTPRQREVARLIVNGQRMKEIAAALRLSPRTVETIKYELMRNLGLHSTPELVRYVIQHRLVEF